MAYRIKRGGGGGGRGGGEVVGDEVGEVEVGEEVGEVAVTPCSTQPGARMQQPATRSSNPLRSCVCVSFCVLF